MAEVSEPARVELTIELAVTAQHIEGTVRSGDRAGLYFSGWSELFAVLETVTSQAVRDSGGR